MTKERPSFTFHKAERLKSNKIIDELFDKRRSKSKVIYPFRIVWMETELPSTFPAQLLISVPKRFVPKANKRNLIKRQIKEAYRLNKHQLYQSISTPSKEGEIVSYQPTIQLAVMFIYLGKEPLPYSFIYGKMRACIRFLSKQYRPKSKRKNQNPKK